MIVVANQCIVYLLFQPRSRRSLWAPDELPIESSGKESFRSERKLGEVTIGGDECHQIQGYVKLRESTIASLLARRDSWLLSRALSD
jgi:hypothetical protein